MLYLYKIKCLDKIKVYQENSMYYKLVVYLFHLIIVFPYLVSLGYRLSHLDKELNFEIDSKIILSVVIVGFFYQILLLWDYSKIIFSN